MAQVSLATKNGSMTLPTDLGKAQLSPSQEHAGEAQHSRDAAGVPRLATPASSGSELTPEYDTGPVLNEAQQLRIACAEAYESASQAFIADQTPASLAQLNCALARLDPEDVDPVSVEKLLGSLPSFLESNGAEGVLLSCQLFVRFDLKRVETLSSYPTGNPELYITAFRQISNRDDLSSKHLPLLAETVELWTALASSGEIEEHQGYHLIASALFWLFGTFSASADAANVRYRFMDLLVETYRAMPRDGRYKAVHDLLTMMLRSAGSIVDAVHLLLRLVAVTGSIPKSLWTEATSLHKRQLLEADAQVRHKDAVALCQMISRRVIDFSYTNTDKGTGGGRDVVQVFLKECRSSLKSPQLPSAEVLLSGFVSTLFTLSDSHRNRRYCVFSFGILRELQETLAMFHREAETDVEVDPVALVSAVHAPEQANYLASRQCTLSGQPYFDLHLAVFNPRTEQTLGYVTDSEWTSFLSQWPIASYYEHICEQICSLADRDDVPDTIQVELFKVLEKVVGTNARLFNGRWLDRLSYASASVCEAMVPVIAAAFARADPRPYDMLHKMGTRLAVPGVKPFKKRAIGLFCSVANIDNSTYEIAWLYLLIALADPDANVSQAASERATHMFFEALNETGVDARLSKALLSARSKAGENSYLVQAGLRKLVNDISRSKEASRVRRLVSNLIEGAEFELAALLVEADGTFMPLGRLPAVFEEVKLSTKNQKAGLRMLSAALSARPRILLAPSMASTMFNLLITRLKTSIEAHIGYIGLILRELVALGGVQVQQERARKLDAVLDASFENLCRFDSVPHGDARQMAVFHQLVMINGCVRFWDDRSQAPERATKIVEKLVAFGREAEAGATLSQLLVRTVFSIAAEFRVLFNNRAVDIYLSALQQGTPEFDCLMQLLFQYDWHKLETEDSDSAASGHQDNFKSMIMGTRQKEEVLATSSMLQRYLAHILQQADQNQNVVALRIISKALDHYLVVVDRCLPLVVSLCFSSRLNVAQAALATYGKICSRWPSSVLTKLVPGLKRCADGGVLNTGPFARVWHLAKSSQTQRNIKLLIEAVVASLHHGCSAAYSKLVITGLMQTPLDPKDARLLKLGIMENVFSFSPRNKAHGAPQIATMILVHVFQAWLTRRYGLSSSRQAEEEDGAETEALEYIDIDTILQRFGTDRGMAKRAYEELLDEQYAYGTREMRELVYGSLIEPAEQGSGELALKKRRVGA